MSRGRRVRAVLAYQHNDDSPHPKRRDQRRQLAQNILTNKSQTITQFFHSVEMDYGKSLVVDDDDDLGLKKANFGRNINYKETEGLIDFNTTPIFIDTKVLDVKSPPTPHRIELCLDEAQPIRRNDDQIVPVQPKGRRRLKNVAQNATSCEKNHKVSEYFPVRRSVRKTKKTVLEEKQRSLEQILRSGVEDGLAVRTFEAKGRGVVASRDFCKGDFVVEYCGDLIDISEAKGREQKYALDQSAGCYMYYFKHKNQQYCIDATAETDRLGRLVNHSRNGNLITRTVSVDGKPRLVLIAKDAIEAGEELTYDYGDRSKESLKHHPWLAL